MGYWQQSFWPWWWRGEGEGGEVGEEVEDEDEDKVMLRSDHCSVNIGEGVVVTGNYPEVNAVNM